METKQVSHARFYALLKQIPQSDKEQFVWEYSGMLTTSLSEFVERKPQEYRQMISDMQNLVNEMNVHSSNDAIKAELKRLRSAILHRLQKHGVDTTDWNKVNAFMRQPRIAGKTLGEMNLEELKSFIPKLQSILTKDKEKQREIERLQQLN
jgi:mevalonate kinase